MAPHWLVGGLLLVVCLLGAGVPVRQAAATIAGTSASAAAAGQVLAASATSCRFVLGFKRLHDLMPARVGACLDNEQFRSSRAESVQHTSAGLLVWRRADNGTAFTDGSKTWLLGPHGLQVRPNDRRFAWEADRQRLPLLPRANGAQGD